MTQEHTKPDWIGVDWGTSNLRVFAVDHKGEVTDSVLSDCGMHTLSPGDFEPVLLNTIDHWLGNKTTTPVYICGMAGAKQGWQEANYRNVPCSPTSAIDLTVVRCKDTRIDVKILPGICQMQPPDVMRGEETQIAGVLAVQPEFSGTICLPGTHSKWVNMSDSIIEQFTTCMTGEMYSLLRQHSVLKHTTDHNAFDQQIFRQTALNALQQPNHIATELFRLRAAALLHNQNNLANKSTLSGLLIGQELAATRTYWDKKPVTIVGAAELSGLYEILLTELGCNVTLLDAATATIAGLSAVASQLNGTQS